jgi:cytochrome c556
MTRSSTVLWAAIAGAGLAAALAGAAVSAGNPVEERQAAMKEVGQAMKEARAFTSAQTPFDPAKVKSLMAVPAGNAKKLKGLYPTDSAADPKTEADPKIWANKADFEKRLAEMGGLATAAGKATDTESFTVALKTLGDSCKSCHDVYRMKKKE